MSTEHSDLKIPKTARSRYFPLKQIGSGKDGIVVLAAPTEGPKTRSTLIALKIMCDDAIGTIEKGRLETLKAVQEQHKDNQLIAAVRDYPIDRSINWMCIDYIPGCSVWYLLSCIWERHSMPPALIFHIFAEVTRAQAQLKEHGLCHIDLKAGGNVMLVQKSGSHLPSVVLVDHSGIKPYNQAKVLEHMVGLLKTMTKGDRGVPQKWQLGFKRGTTILADRLYKAVMMHDQQGEVQNLEELWDRHKESVEVVKCELWDEEEMGHLKDQLRDGNITGEEIKYLIGKGGMKIEVDEWE